ncbi:MAG TPA: 5-formyltetrahydrofolate cyclo-ligase [Bacteroidia bacterium]|nr:5-formyltetrahydrofolate cyclo-ligase [Bacteroidia bacterium]HRS58429.1 5-formyltetrahydrofolate cyclo-ligase [Bacteroidia bacterium]HRU68437.1 5-formyltetrahydrofolate cyclo-ligase [Bacteroidia bacterium]
MSIEQIDIEKKKWRKFIRDEKQKYPVSILKEKSAVIFEQLEKTEVFQKVSVLAAYWSLDDEVSTHDFIKKWYREKEILLPCIKGDDIVFKKFRGTEHLVIEEKYRIPEPDGEVFTELHKIGLIIVPGLAFDKNNNRMGRGKAFYDRLLPQLQAYRIGVCFDFQYFDEIPATASDIKMNQIIYG